MNTKIKVILRINTLVTARIEMITVQVKPIKMMIPHPSAFQRDKCFLIIRRQNRTRLAEKMQKNMLTMSSNHMKMKLNWIHIITSNKSV